MKNPVASPEKILGGARNVERNGQGPLQCPGTSSSKFQGGKPREENEDIWLNLPSHPSF